MSTPFDRALSVQRQTLDRVRLAIAEMARQAAALEQREAELARAAKAERAELGATLIPFDAYFARLRGEAAAVVRARTLAAQELDRLRGEAQAEFGSMKALEQAAKRFRAERERALAAAEQAAADDRSGAEIVRLARARRTDRRA